MNSRVEFERSVTLAGEPVQLFVSCGSQDDYLELVLPEEPELEAQARNRLARLQEGEYAELMDLRFSQDRPATISILALYAGLGASDKRSRPYSERLADILARVVEAESSFDFGELLPERPTARESTPAEEAPRPMIVAEPVMVVPEAEPSAARAIPEVVPVPSASRTAPPRQAPTVDYLGRAGELAARGRIHKALRAVEDALRQNSADREAWALREELQLLERRERRRQREPKSAQAQLEVGFSYLTLGCDAEAIAALREATRVEPNLYLAHLILGIALHHEKQVDQARICYERAARLRPREETPRDLLRALRRGEPPPRPIEDKPEVRAGMSRMGLREQWATAG